MREYCKLAPSNPLNFLISSDIPIQLETISMSDKEIISYLYPQNDRTCRKTVLLNC